jgi:hypothetical protein
MGAHVTGPILDPTPLAEHVSADTRASERERAPDPARSSP